MPPCLLTPLFLVRLLRAVGRHTHIEGLFFLCKDKGKGEGKEAVTSIRHMSSITLCRKQKETECQIPAVHSCPPVLSLAGITGHLLRFRLSLIVSYMHRIVPSSEMDPVSVQCSAVLCCPVRCCAVLCSVVLCCTVQCNAVLYRAVLYCTVLCYAMPYGREHSSAAHTYRTDYWDAKRCVRH